MRKIFLILLLSISVTKMYSQEIDCVVSKLPQNINTLEELTKNDSLTKVYIVDVNQIGELIQKSKKKFKIVFFFSPTCHSSIEMFPKFIEFINKNSTEFELFPVSGLRYNKVNSVHDYLKLINYYNPILILDTEKHGNKAEPFTRLDQLSSAFCPSCTVKKMGFSNFFVIDSNNVEVFNTNYEINLSDIEIFERLTNLH